MNDENSKLLVVQLNGAPILEYDRDKKLSRAQHESLRLIDEKLGQGITLHNTFIARPDLEQRVEFITANLVSALLGERNEDEALAASSCAYLARTLPDLKQIKAQEENGQITIELVFDRAYQQETKINYTPLDKIITRQ